MCWPQKDSQGGTRQIGNKTGETAHRIKNGSKKWIAQQCVLLCPALSACYCYFVVVHIPGNPKKPLEMPFEVGLGVPKTFSENHPQIATLGRFGSFLGYFGPYFDLKLRFFYRKRSFFLFENGGRFKKFWWPILNGQMWVYKKHIFSKKSVPQKFWRGVTTTPPHI